MSLVALSLNLFLAALLLAALAYGIRLDRRLRAVRDGQLAFGKAVAELDSAAEKARAGLAELREAMDESTDLLGGRINRAREAADRLEKLLNKSERSAPATVEAPRNGGGLDALLADLQAAEAPAAVRNLSPRERPAKSFAPSFDEDLFEDVGGRA